MKSQGFKGTTQPIQPSNSQPPAKDMPHGEEAQVYLEPKSQQRKTVGLFLCHEEREPDAFKPERMLLILQGVAEGKKFMPIQVDKDFYVLNGGHRLLAAQMLGLQSIEVMVHGPKKEKI